MREEWRDVKGFEGYYIINNLGSVRSLGRDNKYKKRHNPKELSQRKDKDGYKIVTLYDKDGNRKDFKVHRLVAMTFIPNPNNYPVVNHKNEIRDCNYVENLEWCTVKYNSNYGTMPYKRSIWQKGKPKPSSQGKNNYFYGKHFSGSLSPCSKKVVQYSLNGELLNTYNCTREAGEAAGVSASLISVCCRGLRKTGGGYKWEYA